MERHKHSHPSIQLFGLAPPYHFLQPPTFPRQPVQASVSKPQPLSSVAAPERKLPALGFIYDDGGDDGDGGDDDSVVVMVV